MKTSRFFVNRGGGRVPEGPFEEQQILRLIAAGKLSSGQVFICLEGEQRFKPIDSHPPFASALEQAGVPPTAAAIAAKKKAQAAATKAAQPAVSESRRLLLAAVLAFFVLALGAVGIGTYVMFSNGGMPVHAAVPSDTELLFEIGSVRDAVRDLGWVRSADTKPLAESRLLDAATDDLSASFGVTKSRASALVLAASSVGVAARKLDSAPEGGVLLTFTNASPVNALFNTQHFTYVGLISSNGRKYTLHAAAPPPGPGAVALRALLGLKLDSARSVLVWFETSKVLFVGSPTFAEDVARALSLDSPSLALNPSFQKVQRDFSDKADAVAYLDAARWASASGSSFRGLFENRKLEPAAVSLKLVPAGLLAHAVLRSTPLAAPGSAPTQLVLAPAQPLRVSDRLPSETFAYLAVVTQSPLSGADLRAALLRYLAAGAPEAAAPVALAAQRLEQQLHVSFDSVLSSLGDQAVLAVLAPADYGVALGTPAQMAAPFSIVYLQALKDEAPARALLTQLEATLGAFTAQLQAHGEPGSLSLTPTDTRLGISGQIRIAKGYLCAAFGNNALVARALRAAFEGERTLASEPAQRAARASLPASAQAVAWLDAGRVVSTVLRNPLLSPRLHDFGLDRGDIHWTGAERVTLAAAFSEEIQNGAYVDRVDALNLPAFAGAFLTLP